MLRMFGMNKFEQLLKCLYEGHSEIIDTSLAFWALDEIKTLLIAKVKKED